MTGSDPSAADRLLQEVIAGHFLPYPPERIGVAVSGGSDSLALMALLADWALETAAFELKVATVDHGLRKGSADEAQQVARLAASAGLDHETLRWTGWDGRGNLQDAARRARYDLLADWAAREGLSVVAIGHTADDQAETILMRLARASGVDGLSAMSARRRLGDVTFVRPMLGLRRADLRAFLDRRGLRWIEDPSNENEDFDRVRARHALAALEPLGLTVPALCTVGQNLSAIRETLGWYAFTEARGAVRIEGGDVVIPMADVRRLRLEILRRILLQGLLWVSGADYAPRRKTMSLLIESVRTGTGMNLHGCRVLVMGNELRICREWAAVAGLSARSGELWDGRWILTGQWPDGAEVRPLGEDGLAACPDWRDTGIPRASLLASPSVWRGDLLVSAPFAGRAEGWQAELDRDGETFFSAFLTH